MLLSMKNISLHDKPNGVKLQKSKAKEEIC